MSDLVSSGSADCYCNFDDSCWGSFIETRGEVVFVRKCLLDHDAGGCPCPCAGIVACPGCDECR